MPVQPISQLTPRSVAWLWPARLALGKLALLEGDPGLGKSLLALDLCARLSTGRPFPDSDVPLDAGTVIVLNAEDDEQDTIRPRLQAMGADLDRIFVLHLDEAGPSLRLPGQTDLLEAALERTRARLVVLDPIVAFLESSGCQNSDQAVRRALLPLARLAGKYGCVILLIRHLNKHGGW
ncbi:MAG TPA: AAA family ATPase, partial [Gemmataceae bacterium]|nr:AAA family ATPase [Gemmataceae bacterium]